MKKTNKSLILIPVYFLISILFLIGCDNYLDGMQIYFGNLHSHTAMSDGKGTPTEALEWARYDVGYDFYAITDHSEFYGINRGAWSTILNAVETFTDEGKFLPIRGFEYSNPLLGHINVFGTGDFTNTMRRPSISMVYNWINERNAIAQFNHPGWYGKFQDLFKGLEPLYFEPKVADNMVAIETGNEGVGNNEGIFYQSYIMALDKGWKVAPTNNHDNHELEDYLAYSDRTAVIAEDLTYSSIIDAIKKRRVYSTDDPNMEVVFKYNDHFMGSTVMISEDSVKFTIAINDDEPIIKVELITNKGIVVDKKEISDESTNVLWEPEVEGVENDDYFFVRVTEKNIHDDDVGDTQVALTAPIWITKPGVYLYEHSNWRGNYIKYDKHGEYRNIPAEWNDKISSVKIIGDFHTVLYRHARFRGLKMIVTKSTPKMRLIFNDATSSLKVLPGRQ